MANKTFEVGRPGTPSSGQVRTGITSRTPFRGYMQIRCLRPSYSGLLIPRDPNAVIRRATSDPETPLGSDPHFRGYQIIQFPQEDRSPDFLDESPGSLLSTVFQGSALFATDYRRGFALRQSVLPVPINRPNGDFETHTMYALNRALTHQIDTPSPHSSS